MSPAVAQQEVLGAVPVVLSVTTEVIKEVQVPSEPVAPAVDALPHALLGILFLFLGVAVFVAVMLKRVPSRPEMMQCGGHMKSCLFTYGSINHLDEMFSREMEGKSKRCRLFAQTRPTKFISVSDLWKAKQSNNYHQINTIPEVIEDDGINAII